MIWEAMNKDYDKGKNRKRARMAKKAAPAKKPEKAVKVFTVMDTKNRLSSKINYEALDNLNEELLSRSGQLLELASVFPNTDSTGTIYTFPARGNGQVWKDVSFPKPLYPLVHRALLVAKLSNFIPALKWWRLDESVQQFAVFIMSQVAHLTREAAHLHPLVHPAVLVETCEQRECCLTLCR
ncbi:hypothetical protein ACE6H2_014119 [Prunus campanulata]